MSIVISVEHLSKSYSLGQISTGTFANDLNVWWAKVRGKPNPLLRIGDKDHSNRDGEELWALRDVSFTVEQGEVLGIIGRNGAGKSTLLKILSRVTAPTSGKIKVKGRIASLLEVGTGFHPELTGRENIYLNGAILGMKRDEITRKFDEIVAFAEVEKFIDTPVKRYSSGMYVRLAFAVAAHLEPEILVVDEVLAVGDAAFQKKCLGKMGDVAKEGRTVLFVSHNLEAVKTLCPISIYLKDGGVDYYGQTLIASHKYFNDVYKLSVYNQVNGITCKFTLRDENKKEIQEWPNLKNVTFEVGFSSENRLNDIAVDFALYTLSGIKIFAFQSDKFSGFERTDVVQGKETIFDFVIQNVGITVPEVFVDLGLRQRGQKNYRALFEKIMIIPIEKGKSQLADNIISLPTNVYVRNT